MHRARLVVIVLALGLAGCAGRETADQDAVSNPLSSAELGWVRGYSRLTIDIADENLGRVPGAALVRECRARFAALGEPPTDRLQPSFARAATACPLLARYGSTRRALDAIDDADELIVPYLLETRPLPLRSGITRFSRADIALSDAASGLVDIPIEVRCWTDSEWLRIVREGNARSLTTNDPEELFGFQDDDASRINLLLEQCNLLERLRSDDVLELGHEQQVDIADSVDTLAHEIQHFELPDADEAEVECAALDTAANVAAELGASVMEADALAAIGRTEIYPDLPSEYRGGRCDQ